MHELWNFLSVVIPTKGERLLMVAGGLIGSGITVALGGIDLSIKWLFAFAVVDYITGSAAAFKTGKWNSSTGFKGLFKKFFMFFIIALCNGVDVVMDTELLRNAAIMAYAVNEAGSILENLEALGFADYIPDVLRRGLQVLKEGEDELFGGGGKKNE